MRITKQVELHQEVEVEVDLSAEDISEILMKAMKNSGTGRHIILYHFNSVASYLRGTPDSVISNLGDTHRAVIASFLLEQAGRFAPKEKPTKYFLCGCAITPHPDLTMYCTIQEGHDGNHYNHFHHKGWDNKGKIL